MIKSQQPSLVLVSKFVTFLEIRLGLYCRWGGIVLKNSYQRATKKVLKTHLVSPGDSLERGGCRNGGAVRERGGFREWKGDAGLM